jgi:CRP-like cAMP-binding protein
MEAVLSATSNFAPARQDINAAIVRFPTTATRRVAVREQVYRQGEAATHLYEVLQGGIMVLRRLRDGRRQILDIAGPGRIIGLTAEQCHDCEAVALKTSIVLCLDRKRGAQGPSSRMEAALFDEVHRLRDLATALGRKTAMERLAGFLLALAGNDDDVPLALDLPVTRTEIADHLGLALETVSRNFARMKQRNVIRCNGSFGLAIRDFVTLRQLAEGILA